MASKINTFSFLFLLCVSFTCIAGQISENPHISIGGQEMLLAILAIVTIFQTRFSLIRTHEMLKAWK